MSLRTTYLLHHDYDGFTAGRAALTTGCKEYSIGETGVMVQPFFGVSSSGPLSGYSL